MDTTNSKPEEKEAKTVEETKKSVEDNEEASNLNTQVTHRQKRRRRPEKSEVPEKRTKRDKEQKEIGDEIPMNIPYKIIDGVRHLSPYWAVYRTRTKGRWIGRSLVDVFSAEFQSLNKHYMTVACKLGRVWVNGERLLDLDYRLKNGDRIEHVGHRHEHPVRDLPIEVIEDNANLLVVNKPPSLPVHACGQYAVHTVLGQLRTQGRERLRVLHRLDRTTSGVLLFAKNYETDLEFKKTLKLGEWTKEYLCKVEGVFPDGEVVCEEKIGILVISMGIQCVRPDGKEAKSTFKRIWTDGKDSVLSVRIETGRTHQIRVHAQFLGYPIVGDQLYNSTVWGDTKGAGAKYGKSFEELGKNVQANHRSQNWHESIDPDYEQRMERMSQEELAVEPYGNNGEGRPDYDLACLNCNVIKKEVPPNHFQMYLHCLRYETSKWTYSSPLPDWAVQR